MKAKRIRRGPGPLLCLFMLFGMLSCSRQPPPEEVVTRPGESVAELISRADKLYSEREDLSRVRAGAADLRRAQALDAGNYELAWRLSRISYYLGAHTTDADERDRAFNEGVKAGQQAVELRDDRPEGHFWLGANYGGRAQHSRLAGLTAVDDIIREMEAVLRIDEGYQAGSAYMALGQVYLNAPRMFGGDKQKAVAMLEKGLRFGENNALLRLRLAEAYGSINRNDEARKQLDAIKDLKPNPDYLPEYKEAVAEAEKLRATLQ